MITRRRFIKLSGVLSGLLALGAKPIHAIKAKLPSRAPLADNWSFSMQVDKLMAAGNPPPDVLVVSPDMAWRLMNDSGFVSTFNLGRDVEILEGMIGLWRGAPVILNQDLETTTLEEVFIEYAAQTGKTSLSEAEKQQAFLNAVLDGKQIEPFCFYNDIIMDDMNSAIAGAMQTCLTRAVNSQT